MEKFVVVGQSRAVVTAVKTIRSLRPEALVTIVSCDGQYPYDRFLLPLLIGRKLKDKDLFLETEEFYKANNIEVILDKEITRINFNRRRVFLAERNYVDYDVLIMADMPGIRLPEIKGNRRTGVFHLSRLETVKSLIRYLPFTETALIQVTGAVGIETALFLKALGKEVLVSTSQERLLAEALPAESSNLLAALLEKRGIRSLLNNNLDDILGDSELKAVRFKSGKVMACDMVLFEDVAPDLRFLNDNDLVLTERIHVTGSMASNMANVYALDSLCQMETPKIMGSYSLDPALADRQAEVAIKNSLGEAAVLDNIPPKASINFEKLFTETELAEVRTLQSGSPLCSTPLQN
ncbi:MAG: FAD-dependent oxidoreductase [Candidatus Omnitrophica bacterium]|nr:FAD-dependent oxidoreductase [Candidatus Omnitrophota bacterium]